MIEVVNPNTEEVVARVAEAGRDDMDRARRGRPDRVRPRAVADGCRRPSASVT